MAEISRARCLKTTKKSHKTSTLRSKRSKIKSKNGSFWRVFKKTEACSQTVLPDRSILRGQKI